MIPVKVNTIPVVNAALIDRHKVESYTFWNFIIT
jgi:hypothetical protein